MKLNLLVTYIFYAQGMTQNSKAMLSSVDNRVKHRMKSMNEAYFIVYVIVNKS